MLLKILQNFCYAHFSISYFMFSSLSPFSIVSKFMGLLLIMVVLMYLQNSEPV